MSYGNNEDKAGVYAKIDMQGRVLTKAPAEQCYCLFCCALLPMSSSEV